ncbi:hypothetical protein FRACYDRAFT_240901 [Fragilariopsis cylindrus CCMP1102]|uniref:Spondin domain-containing protein n=1 Tax=Fragilariopsis cylindrus CCMP1102 TaxID=635003 RepID=A0A1E7F862_9STRA|nr:hypothetical protein FRACYDRAFT_240901 [Fragilariopsis cylindrus CCMP1102]|eukprot:OEU14361.1 hypothetical protein FRACYDRAFT_240901 [Fragilariopsis cylindrus CCMP1102]
MKFGSPTIIVQAVVYLLLLSSCEGCTLDGCDHPDCGSCGNSCCSLLITVKESTESVMNQLNKSITEGGPDNLYIPMMTAGGTLTFSDLRQYGLGADFNGQAVHTTLNGKYNDTVNFSLSPTTILDKNNNNINATVIAAFSISEIAGAYCDSGQNYWNILQLVQGIQWESGTLDVDQQVEHVGNSCPTNNTSSKDKNKDGIGIGDDDNDNDSATEVPVPAPSPTDPQASVVDPAPPLAGVEDLTNDNSSASSTNFLSVVGVVVMACIVALL